ncbi:MAG: right-handed parallel beta-helix repeat-containing protein, partial [Phycisphaerales bacterium]|nr:right-handed parallel beta-helix repeat-containing protein [Phycisphaerales bacterium]
GSNVQLSASHDATNVNFIGGAATIFENCRASDQFGLGTGFQCNGGCLLSSVRVDNQLTGIQTNGSSVLRNPSINRCTVGVDCTGGENTVFGGSIFGCTIDAVRLKGDDTVSDCRIDSTGGGTAILVEGTGNTVTDNHISRGGFHGIYVKGTESTNNTVTGNICSHQVFAIRVESAGNLIMANFACGASNTNYEIAPGNKVGSISTDPTTANAWANHED